MNSLFYCGIKNKEILNDFIDKLDTFSESNSKTIYILDKPLGNDGKIEEYDYVEKAILLIPNQKILLINYGRYCDEFEDFADDFIDDLEFLSKRYNYQKSNVLVII